MKKEMAQKLIDFSYNSPTAYQATENIKEELLNNGYIEVFEKNKWNLKKGGKYLITRNDSALIAFEIGSGDISDEGFRIIGAHTDSPTFRINPNAEIKFENTYVKLNTKY